MLPRTEAKRWLTNLFINETYGTNNSSGEIGKGKRVYSSTIFFSYYSALAARVYNLHGCDVLGCVSLVIFGCSGSGSVRSIDRIQIQIHWIVICWIQPQYSTIVLVDGTLSLLEPWPFDWEAAVQAARPARSGSRAAKFDQSNVLCPLVFFWLFRCGGIGRWPMNPVFVPISLWWIVIIAFKTNAECSCEYWILMVLWDLKECLSLPILRFTSLAMLLLLSVSNCSCVLLLSQWLIFTDYSHFTVVLFVLLYMLLTLRWLRPFS